MDNNTLLFYKQPFRKSEYCGWVYDANENFVFQFETIFDEKGNYAAGEEDLMKSIIDSINSEDHIPIESMNLLSKDGQILDGDRELITIRGWGNLTGVGAHNFSGEKAAKIQDDFEGWLIAKLSKIK